MSKVLIYVLGGQGCQEAGQLDEAVCQYEIENQVLVLHCDKLIGGCRDNQFFNKFYCANCVFFQRKRANKYFKGRNIEYKSISDYYNQQIAAVVDSFKANYNNVADLKNLKYKGVDIGFGLLSSYISATRNLYPDITDELRASFDRILKTEVLVIELLLEAIKSYSPDLLIVHNGRHWTYRPVEGLAKSLNIEYICTEFIHLADGTEGKNYYYNTYPHDKVANANKYLDFWENVDDEDKVKVGESFFRGKRDNKYVGDTVYTKDQKQELLPEDYDRTKRNIVIFNSSEDEMFSINKEIDADMLFPSQIEGINAIVEHFKNEPNVHLYLRIHPHLGNITYSYHTDLYKIKAPNFTIIPADSPISSYAMLDIAETVIVFGSTMGVEASYQGKKVINLAFAFYDPLNIVYRPETVEELWKYLDINYPKIQNNENAIKMGYYMVSQKHPRLTHVPLKTYRFSVFGKAQEAHSYRTILGSPKLNWLYFKILSLLSRI